MSDREICLNIVEAEVAPESESLKSATRINRYTADVCGIVVKLWDTPAITVGKVMR